MLNRWTYYGFLSNQDDLIRFWWRIQFPITLFFSIALSISTINPKYAFLITLFLFVFCMQFMGLLSSRRASKIHRILIKSQTLIFRHKDSELRKVFTLAPKILKIIIFLDFLFPISFPISFILKIAFSKNTLRMKCLMVEKQ